MPASRLPVRDLILRCTAKAAEQRPQSLREVIDVVRRATPRERVGSGATTRTSDDSGSARCAWRATWRASSAEPRKPFAGRPVVLILVAVIGVIAIAAAIIYGPTG